MTRCANCHHSTETHSDAGCFVDFCSCLFDYDGKSALKGTCPKTYTTINGRIIPCVKGAGHDGRHNGYYVPGSKTLSHWTDEQSDAAASTQVGGDHYAKFKIQPWAVIDEYGLDYYLGNVVKYVLRAGHKGPKLQDLQKAKHYIEKCIEIEEGGQ